MTHDPDLTPEALDALVHMLGEWSACDEEAQAAAAITALRARLAEAEAALSAEQSDAIAARKRVRDLIEDFNRQVQRTEEQRAAYEARLSVMESDLTAAREEGARMALEAARGQAPTGAPLTMEAIRLVAAEGDLTPQAVLGAANYWIGRRMEAAVRRALWEARDKCMPHNDDDGMDRQAKAQCADAILALANNPEAIKRIVGGGE